VVHSDRPKHAYLNPLIRRSYWQTHAHRIMYSHFSCAGLQAGKTLLMCVSQCGHEESVRELIKKGASLEAVDEVRHMNL
jgi:hypothetical protein